MEDIAVLKSEIKGWERLFKSKNGREPSVEDIKSNPVIAAKYKQYKKLGKSGVSKSYQQQPSLLSTPKKASRPANTEPLQSFNPFSPTKRQAQRLKPQLPPSNIEDPFIDATISSQDTLYATPNPLSRARKRLRGEPVSPSPNKVKRARMECAPTMFKPLEIEPDDREDVMAVEPGSSVLHDSPVKRVERPKSFGVLFSDNAPVFLAAPETNGTRMVPRLKVKQADPPGSAMVIDPRNSSSDSVRDSLDKLLPPSPKDGSGNTRKVTHKATAKRLQVSDDDESMDGFSSRIKVIQRSWEPIPLNIEDDELSLHLNTARPTDATEEEVLEVNIPEKFRNVVAVSSVGYAQHHFDNNLVSELVYGRRERNYIPDKGGEIWDVGEDDRHIGEAGFDSEDDWESGPIPWEIGEL